MKEILIFVSGVLVALFTSYIKSILDRETRASGEIFQKRLDAISEIWQSFVEVKDAYATKVTLGHENWKKFESQAALDKLNEFRQVVDLHQVVLPSEILDQFRDLDMYMYSLVHVDGQVPSDYLDELNSKLVALSSKINVSMGKRTQKIELKFR